MDLWTGGHSRRTAERDGDRGEREGNVVRVVGCGGGPKVRSPPPPSRRSAVPPRRHSRERVIDEDEERVRAENEECRV